MDANQEAEVGQRLARQVQHALQHHKVHPERLGETVSFLSVVLGGMIGVIFAVPQHHQQIKALRGDIEYGIEHGVPED